MKINWKELVLKGKGIEILHIDRYSLDPAGEILHHRLSVIESSSRHLRFPCKDRIARYFVSLKWVIFGRRTAVRMHSLCSGDLPRSWSEGYSFMSYFRTMEKAVALETRQTACKQTMATTETRKKIRCCDVIVSSNFAVELAQIPSFYSTICTL